MLGCVSEIVYLCIRTRVPKKEGFEDVRERSDVSYLLSVILRFGLQFEASKNRV